MDSPSKLQRSLYASSIEEAQVLARRCAEPRPAGDQVKGAIRRASRRLNMPFSRVRDVWYGNARRISADEIGRLRRAAEHAEFAHAVAAIEVLRNRLLASRSSKVHEVIASLTGALLALGRYAGENGLSQEPPGPQAFLLRDFGSRKRDTPTYD